jgi:outer membrane protein assembly factor BamB
MNIEAHTVGTKRRSVIGGNTLESLSDVLASSNGKGFVCVDSQGTAEFWRISVDSTGLKDATLSVDANGLVTGTRAASATGTVTLKIADIGTAAPAT